VVNLHEFKDPIQELEEKVGKDKIIVVNTDKKKKDGINPNLN